MQFIDDKNKAFPEGMTPVGDAPFQFACHPGVECFTRCCRKLELYLYPYDIIRLKNKLGIDSEAFLEKYAGVVQGANPFFPALILRMQQNEEYTCPFLLEGEGGCSVYEDRPSSCRMYPLERAVERKPSRGRPAEFYFMTNHDYCLGHREDRTMNVKDWLRDQHLLSYNLMDDLWAEMDTFFAGNPWQGEGAAGPRQQLAFMVCYNIDGFRRYCEEHKVLADYKLSKSELRELERDDEALLRFGYKWLRHVLVGEPTLTPRRR